MKVLIASKKEILDLMMSDDAPSNHLEDYSSEYEYAGKVVEVDAEYRLDQYHTGFYSELCTKLADVPYLEGIMETWVKKPEGKFILVSIDSSTGVYVDGVIVNEFY